MTSEAACRDHDSKHRKVGYPNQQDACDIDMSTESVGFLKSQSEYFVKGRVIGKKRTWNGISWDPWENIMISGEFTLMSYDQ